MPNFKSISFKMAVLQEEGGGGGGGVIQKTPCGIGLTGVIRYMSKYVKCDVLEQMYELYVLPHLDYGAIIYHKYDPDPNWT